MRIFRRQRRAKTMFAGGLYGLVVAGLFVPFTVAAGSDWAATNDLSLEDLINIKVTTVSKKETSLEHSPAAITVITQDDIRRLGIENIPDALRLVPGMDVAQINAHEWAVSARGFNDQFANKLLVLIDGRAIYTPSFGGVFWDVQDIPMEDIERIEVIRGPGATLWGANAVNGVINIITKDAKDTQGLLVSQSLDNELRMDTTVRYGGMLATNLYYRGYVKYFNGDGFVDSAGNDTPDDWDCIHGGLRLDLQSSDKDSFTLQGDGYHSVLHENVDLVTSTAPYWQSVNTTDHDVGGNILGRWTRKISDSSQLSVQAYNDYASEEIATAAERQDTLDLDAQHWFALGGWNNIIWGLGYRCTFFNFSNGPYMAYNPTSRRDQLLDGFVQDEVTIIPERLHFTAGTKLEHNDYTGFEVEPSARLAWTPTDRQTVWCAVSRAVRTPAIFNLSAQVNEPFLPSPPVSVVESINPNPELTSETLLAYEAGYRIQPFDNLSFDLAGFYNIYHDLIVYVPGTQVFNPNPPPGYVTQFVTTENGGSSDTYGVELSAEWKPLDNWRLAASYSLFEQSLHPSAYLQHTAPEQQAQLRSYLDITPKLQFNGTISYVDPVTSLNVSEPTSIPSYVRLDLGLVWRPMKSLELGIWGNNLLQSRHKEFAGDTTTLLTEVPRSIMAKVTLRF